LKTGIFELVAQRITSAPSTTSMVNRRRQFDA
jgi:hypothetical protein